VRQFLFFVLLVPQLLSAQGTDYIRSHYLKSEIVIPMRDGKRLFTVVYQPRESGPHPFLIQRTPYGCSPVGIDQYPSTLGLGESYVRSGYIFVCQEVRGRYRSEGIWLEMTPHRQFKQTPQDVDESSDTFDTIAWLLANFNNHNGRAGLHGVSYPGYYAAAGMIDAHPALAAVSPQAPVIDLFRGDDAYHNGAFFLAANFSFYTFFDEHKQPQAPAPRSSSFDFGTRDGYEFFLNLGPLANADERYFKFANPYWTDLMKHTSFDSFYRERNLEPHIRGISPAVLAVGGWYDAEDLQGPLRLARAARANQPKGPITLVMGPWSHGGWRGAGESLGPISFASKTGEWFRENVELPFFEHHLKGKRDPSLPAAVLFETGRNEWRRFREWPPAESLRRQLFFHPNGQLSFEPPSEEGAFDEYVSDPAKPVPFTPFTTLGMNREYMIADQRFAASRPDVLVYRTAPLDKDMTLAGPIQVRLHVSTSGTDSDWVVKLIDVHPSDAPDPSPNPRDIRMGGYQQLIRGEPFRGRFHSGFEKPQPLPAGKFVEISYEMPDILHTFRRGHRIMVQVQSSWFPLTDRNPQKFVPSIPDARAEDFIKATQRVSRSRRLPSSLSFAVLPPGESQ